MLSKLWVVETIKPVEFVIVIQKLDALPSLTQTLKLSNTPAYELLIL